MMKDCWLEPYTQRPSFNDIVSVLENILEDDAVSVAFSVTVPLASPILLCCKNVFKRQSRHAKCYLSMQ
jgi:hypothetical protein